MCNYGEFKLEIMSESGYEEALMGLSLSYYREGTDITTWWEGQYPKAVKRATKQAVMGGGHSKFVASINTQMLIRASRAFWQEFDTYNFVTKNSASTMHTLLKEPVNKSHFIKDTAPIIIDYINQLIDRKADINEIKANLPEGYLQTRQVSVNYMSLQCMYHQRKKHRLTQWRDFCEQLTIQLEHPELILGE